jgi:putative transferase (TIGR04331 family)
MRQCWPGDAPTLLGPWCLSETERRQGERTARTVPSPWTTRADLHQAHEYVTALHERLLPPLGDALNRLHGVPRTSEYWRLMLGGWLLSFLPALYERFRTLDAAYRFDPHFVTGGLAPDCFITPGTTIELPRRIIGDHYNLQLYTRLLDATGRPYVRCRVPPPAPEPAPPDTGWLRPARRALSALARALPARPTVLAHASSFPRSIETRLIVRLGGRYRPLLVSPPVVQAAPLHPAARATLRDAVVGHDAFTQALREVMPLELPVCFVEGYSAVVAAARVFPRPPAAILSANGWYYDEPFKHWAASAREQGTRLLGVQHGGNYGGGDHLPSEAFEVGLVDRYYTWGWRKARYGNRVQPMPAPKLIGRPVLGASNARRGVLLATTHLTRYPLNFVTSVAEFEQYLQAHRQFVEALPPDVRRELRVRLHREDFGWEIEARWRLFAPDVALESWDTAFATSLRNCRVYVCDHHSTTFLEALSADKPTVLFWDPDTVDLAPEYADRYDALRAVGILHDTPEQAARQLRDVYPDIEAWWHDPALQRARHDLCRALGRTSSDALDQWAAELGAQAAAAGLGAPAERQ